ncbi:MAG: arginine--tRNA ligase [Candidatus Vogelbacteria bacterium RIFOXYD1_FULL_44_32]|uniref:Arginine--tRNA ligase n=1 Tax=Candidatus Vogelbacteria bacterium RIFOXYD1_FULL_44_32 TaxID=1802438 RepID=A0A1G2QEW6_9BACT|nr:MAG: arginine--tRNA ligase [Candidatus Vogelbacteria bacterium RIFOXYD1_FULL_44_32]
MTRSNIEKALVEELKLLGIRGPKITLEHPADPGLGDYATNVALIYAKKLGANPIELAGQLVQSLKNRHFPEVEKIVVAGFGFINFYLKPEFFEGGIKKIIGNEKFGQGSKLKNEKTIVEYTDPNPFKTFHIGHLMSNTIGEAVSRLLEWNGAEIKRACYQGDVGLHIAKAIYGLQKKPGQFWKEKFFGTAFSRVSYLGVAYALGAKQYDESKEVQKEIAELNKKIYERSDMAVNRLYDAGRKWSLDHFEIIYQRLGTDFNFYFFESEAGPFGKELINEFLKKDVFTESDGAIVFKGEAHGLHTRVFLNSQGLPTYEAKELGLAKMKYDLYPYDRSVVVTGNEIDSYFKVIKKVMEFVFPDLEKKTHHISHGMLRLPSGKMSSRTGDVVAAEDLLAEVENKVLEKLADRQMAKSEKKSIAEAVAVAAIKFSILKQAPGRDTIFDLEKSVSFEGDSGPYLQYTAVRAGSVLDKAVTEDLVPKTVRPEGDVVPLERLLYQFPEIVERAGTEYAPQYIVTYLLELASAYNGFYGANKIIDVDNPAVSAWRLALSAATRTVMTNGLTVLGIRVPEQM